MPWTPTPRQPIPSFGRRSVPTGAGSIHTVIRKQAGVSPEEILLSFSGARLSQRQRAATEQLGGVLVRQAKHYAPKSDSPATSGNMAAGIRLVRVSANTVEIVAPPPALWRIEGFPETGGLRPWLAKGGAGKAVALVSRRDANRMHDELRGAMRTDFIHATNAHRTALGLHQQEGSGLKRELHDINTGLVELEHRYDASARKMTKEEASDRRAEIEAQASSLEDAALPFSNRAEAMMRRSEPGPRGGAVRTPMTPERKQQIVGLFQQSDALLERAKAIRAHAAKNPIVAGRSIIRPREVEAEVATRVPQLVAAKQETVAKLRAHRQATPRAPDEDSEMSSRGQHFMLRGPSYRQAVHRLKTMIGRTTGRVSIPVLQYGNDGLRSTTLQKLLEGAFRYPVGVDFLAQAVNDPESKEEFLRVSKEFGDASVGLRAF